MNRSQPLIQPRDNVGRRRDTDQYRNSFQIRGSPVQGMRTSLSGGSETIAAPADAPTMSWGLLILGGIVVGAIILVAQS